IEVGPGELDAQHHREHAADQKEDEDRDEEHHADPLVVAGEEPALHASLDVEIRGPRHRLAPASGNATTGGSATGGGSRAGSRKLRMYSTRAAACAGSRIPRKLGITGVKPRTTSRSGSIIERVR